MGVSKKGRRTIVWNRKEYIWYVQSDEELEGEICLFIISEDKKLLLSYPLNSNPPFIFSQGTEFQGKHTSGRWITIAIPFEIPDIITPKTVSKLIEWATEGTSAEIIKNLR